MTYEGARLLSSFSFDLISECYVCCGDNLKWFALDCASCEGVSTSGNAVVTSQEYATRIEVAYNLLVGMNHLAAFYQLYKARLTRVHSPSTTMSSCRLPKNRKQTCWTVKEALKGFYGYPWVGGVANGTKYISSDLSSHDTHLYSDTEALQLIHR